MKLPPIVDVYDLSGRHVARGPLLRFQSGRQWVPGKRTYGNPFYGSCMYETTVIRPEHKVVPMGEGE